MIVFNCSNFPNGYYDRFELFSPKYQFPRPNVILSDPQPRFKQSL